MLAVLQRCETANFLTEGELLLGLRDSVMAAGSEEAKPDTGGLTSAGV